MSTDKYASDSFLKDVDAGKSGENRGLPNGFEGINKYIFRTQKGRYYLVGADSGVGKTTLTDYSFVFAPYYFAKQNDIPIKFTYFSFEIGKSIKRASWASRLLYERHGLRLPVGYILSQGKFKVSKEHIEKFEDISPELEQMFKDVDFIWDTMTPSNIFKYLFKQAQMRGKFHYETYFDSDEVEKNRIIGYTPNDLNEPWIIIIDHIALVELEQGLDLKRAIDKVSSHLVFFRNICNCIVVPIQQFNSELGSIERQKYKKSAIAPQKSDFGDSKYTYRDADVVIGLLKPAQFDLTEYMGWDITQMGDYAIWMFLMKNRYGPTNKVFGLIPDPIVGGFTEMPRTLLEAERYYEIARDLQEEEAKDYYLNT